jgi:hypothetical protein
MIGYVIMRMKVKNVTGMEVKKISKATCSALEIFIILGI